MSGRESETHSKAQCHIPSRIQLTTLRNIERVELSDGAVGCFERSGGAVLEEQDVDH